MDMLRDIFTIVCNMSITASFVILMVIMMRLVLKKSPKKFSYYLWSIVGFRLLCPISFTSRLSIFNLPFIRNTSIAGSTMSWHQAPDYKSSNLWSVNAPGAEAIVEKIVVDGIEEELIHEPEPLFQIGMFDIKAIVWLVVCLVFLGYQLYSYLKLKKRLEMAVRMEGNIYESDSINDPFVLGFFRPRIYIPFRLSEKEKIFVLEHEKYHIKRHDYQIKLLSIILLAIHWFNPFAWLAYYLTCRDMEMSCDEYVITKLGSEMKQDYSTSLLNFAFGKKRWSLGTLAFGETSVLERVQNILKFKKPGKVAIAISIVACFVAVLFGLSNGGKENAIRNVTKEAGDSVQYEYQLEENVQSVIIYKEYYRYGELEEYEIVSYGDFGEDNQSCSREGTITVKHKMVDDQDGLWCVNMEVWRDGGGFGLSEKAEEYGYKGMAYTSYLESSGSWEKINTEQMIPIKVFLMDDGDGVTAYPAESYLDEELKQIQVADTPGVIIYSILFSEKDSEKLLKEYEIPVNVKSLLDAKNPYIGNHVADGTILRLLGVSALGNYTMELQTSEEPYGLILHFAECPENEVSLHEKMLEKAALFLALTENAGYVEWTYPSVNGSETKRQRYYASDIEQMLGISDLKAFASSEEALKELMDGVKNSDWALVESRYLCKDVLSGKRAFTRKELITGRHPNAEKDSTCLVYSYEKIKFEDITNYLFGSQYPKEKDMYIVIQP